MNTNDLNAGTEIKLASGHRAILIDNKKGDVRMVKVCVYEEMGNTYACDIISALVNGVWTSIDHSAA